jgi:hypothetical protein
MLGIGAAAGAALGPGPESSLAGPGALKQELPALLAAIEARERAAAAATGAAAVAPPAVTPEATPAAKRRRSKVSSTGSSGSSTAPASSEEAPSGSSGTPKTATKKLPATSAVWLIQLSGTSFSTALAQPSAAPYIDSQAIPAGALLASWSAVQGSAFADDAALAEPPPAGAPPALVHSIVQPPCPEGAAGAACAPETPGQLAAADSFLKETLATITGTPAYREHGLVVITFATVAQPTQAGLAAGSSSAALTSTPPAGVLLLSPFAKAAARPTTSFDATSPRQSLEALLH